MTSSHLQSDDPLVDVFPHAHLHVKLGKAFVGICARCSHLLTGRHMLREVQYVPLNWGAEGRAKQRAGVRQRKGRAMYEADF